MEQGEEGSVMSIPPQTLPADFFEASQGKEPPSTLPADFFQRKRGGASGSWDAPTILERAKGVAGKEIEGMQTPLVQAGPKMREWGEVAGRFYSGLPEGAPLTTPTSQFIAGTMGDIGEKVVTPLTSPLNLALLIGGAGMAPQLSRIMAGAFSAVQLKDAALAAKEGKWQDAAIALGFAGLAAAGAAHKKGISLATRWKDYYLKEGMPEVQAVKAASLSAAKGTELPIEFKWTAKPPAETPVILPQVKAGEAENILRVTPPEPEMNVPQPARLEAIRQTNLRRFGKMAEEDARVTEMEAARVKDLRTVQPQGAELEAAAKLKEDRLKQAASEPRSFELQSSLDPRRIGKAFTEYIGEPFWRGATDLLNGLLGKSESLSRWLVTRYGQPEAYVEAAKGRTEAIGKGVERATELGGRLTRGLTQPEQQQLARFMKGEVKEPELRRLRTDERWADAVEAAKQSRVELDTLGGEAVMQDLLSSETFVKNYGKYMPRVYRRFEVEYEGLLERYGEKKPTRIEGDRFRYRKDLPEAVRKLYGEIEEAGYPTAKGITEITGDVETAKLFNFVADNPDWTILKPKGFTRFDEGDLLALGLNPKEFTPMPESPKLGQLSGAFVNKYIAEDLNKIIRPKTEWQKVSSGLISEWKWNKVVANPATHGRNIMSNFILSYLGGMNPLRVDLYGKALREVVKDGPIYRQAKQAGLGGGATFTQGELGGLLDTWNATSGGPMERFSKMGELARSGKYSAAMREARPSQTKAGRALSNIYQGEEQWFKLAKYMDSRGKGMSPKEAVADAQKWLFDYSEVPKFVEWARRSPFGSPFLTFTWKALPVIAESAVKQPWRIGALAYTLNSIADYGQSKLQMTESERKQVEAILPERMKASLAQLTPKSMLLPYRDKYGQLQYLDLTYILPWGDIGESGRFPAGKGIPFANVMPGLASPLLTTVGELMAGESFYTGKSLFPSEPTGTEKASGLALHVWRQWAPPMAPGGYGFKKLAASLTEEEDYFGRTNSIPAAVASTLMGIKINPIDVRKERGFRVLELEKRMETLEQDARRIRQHRGKSDSQKDTEINALRGKAENLRKQARQILQPNQKETSGETQ